MLDDATPAPAPSSVTASEAADDPLRDHPTALLDERVRAWLKERERYERRRTAPPEAAPAPSAAEAKSEGPETG